MKRPWISPAPTPVFAARVSSSAGQGIRSSLSPTLYVAYSKPGSSFWNELFVTWAYFSSSSSSAPTPGYAPADARR